MKKNILTILAAITLNPVFAQQSFPVDLGAGKPADLNVTSGTVTLNITDILPSSTGKGYKVTTTTQNTLPQPLSLGTNGTATGPSLSDATTCPGGTLVQTAIQTVFDNVTTEEQVKQNFDAVNQSIGKLPVACQATAKA